MILRCCWLTDDGRCTQRAVLALALYAHEGETFWADPRTSEPSQHVVMLCDDHAVTMGQHRTLSPGEPPRG